MEKTFETKEALYEAAKELCSRDVWSKCYINEAKLVDLPNTPVILDAQMKTMGIPVTPETEDATEKAMATTQTAWKGVVNGQPMTLPVSELALESLSARAGLSGRSIKAKPLILNDGLELYKEECTCLVREGALVAEHSKDYVPLRQDQLLEGLYAGLSARFSNMELMEATISERLTWCSFKIRDVSCQKKLSAVVSASNLNKEIYPAVMFTTSDTANSGARLYPCICLTDNIVPIGAALSVRHYVGASIENFMENVDEVYNLLSNAIRNTEELEKIRIQYPEKCFVNVCDFLHIPVSAWKPIYEDFEAMHPAICSAFTIFEWVAETMSGYKVETAQAQIAAAERIAGLYKVDFASLDRP